MERLKDLRLKMNLRQIDVATMIGVDRTTYTKYENGDSEPNNEMMKKLSDFFGTSTDYLLGLTDIKKPPSSEDEERLKVLLANADEETREIIELLDQLNPGNLERAKEYIRFELARQGDVGDKP